MGGRGAGDDAAEDESVQKSVPINSSISVKHRHSSGTVTGRNSKNINPNIQKEKEALPPTKQVISGYPYCVRSLQGGGSERKR